MRTYRNTDAHRRVWLSLTDPQTGRTLELAPGEERDLDLPRGFSDPWLVTDDPEPPVARRRKVEGALPDTTPEVPAEVTAPTTEEISQ